MASKPAYWTLFMRDIRDNDKVIQSLPNNSLIFRPISDFHSKANDGDTYYLIKIT